MQKHMTHALRAALLTLGLAGISGPAGAQETMSVYGYFATRLEKTWNEPSASGNSIVKESEPRAWSSPFFNVMLQHQLSSRFRAYVNLNGAGASTVDVRNAWGEASLSPKANFRVGKQYRRFGLYNEVLDAVPTYYGIEPPEAFDSDHLLVTRTTMLSFFGEVSTPAGALRYSLATDNGESGALTSSGQFPLAGDFRLKFNRGRNTVGLSAFASGETGPDRAVGTGSPKSGVLPWMASDKFSVVNPFVEFVCHGATVQFEYAYARHSAVRDPARVVQVVQKAGLNARQRARMLRNPAGTVNDANVLTAADYDVKNWYVRVGHSTFKSAGEFGPYIQWDWYSNPETIKSKTWGGDNEAGAADDGKFSKATVGMVYRPIPQVAIKLDGSTHYYRLLGRSVSYPEIRFDISYMFGL